MDTNQETSNSGEQPKKASKWENFGDWWKRDQNKVYAAMFIFAGYMFGTLAGELNARRRYDRNRCC